MTFAGAYEGARTLPLLSDYTWNHTTLWAMKADAAYTYLQCGFSPTECREQFRKLRERYFGVAEKSHHLLGKALDITFSGKVAKAEQAALTMQRGGVGWYPDSHFIHLDPGPVRHCEIGAGGLENFLVGSPTQVLTYTNTPAKQSRSSTEQHVGPELETAVGGPDRSDSLKRAMLHRHQRRIRLDGTERIAEGSPALWAVAEAVFKDAVAKGWLLRPSDPTQGICSILSLTETARRRSR